MLLIFSGCNLILFFFISDTIIAQECSVNIKKDLLSKSPVFLKNGELHIPNGPYLTWNSGEETYLICSGSKNHFKSSLSLNDVCIENVNSAKIKCNSCNKLTINGKRSDLKKLECNSYNMADVRNTNEKCLNDGTIHEIGFNTVIDGFVKYIQICYNLEKASIKYARHTIHGEAINYSISESTRPSFSVRAMPKHVRPNTSYKQSAQRERFTQLLGSKLTEIYLNSTSFLARGHLSPDKDGIFRSWQYATYFYLNVAPQWQSINAINWLRVENLTRKKAALLKDDLEIITGVAGTLTLKDDKGKQVLITLEENGNIIVPKYFWKILKYKNSAIAFVSLNNPFEYSEPVCKNICEQYNWTATDFNILEKGLIYCCSTHELRKAFPSTVPKDLITKRILSY